MTESDEPRKVLTANRLTDGAIVYLALHDGKAGWVSDIREATSFAAAEAATMEHAAQAEVAANVVLSPYVIDITEGNAPTSAKESVRSAGPSVAYGHAARATDLKH